MFRLFLFACVSVILASCGSKTCASLPNDIGNVVRDGLKVSTVQDAENLQNRVNKLKKDYGNQTCELAGRSVDTDDVFEAFLSGDFETVVSGVTIDGSNLSTSSPEN